MTRMLAALTVLLLAACASSPRAPAFDPAGIYDISAEVQGNAVGGTLVLRRTDQGLAGSFTTPLSGEIALDGVSSEGRKLTLRARVPDGEVVMNLEFAEENRFTGSWSLAGMGGTITGTRRPRRP